MLTEELTSSVPQSSAGVRATLREAIRGSRLDYTTAPIGRSVVMLAIPMVMEMAMDSIGAELGSTGVFIAMAVAYSSLAVVSAVLFRRGLPKKGTATFFVHE